MVPEGNNSQLELMQARVKTVPKDWAFNYVGTTFEIKNNLRKPISEEERKKNPGDYPYYGPTKIQGYIGTFEQDGSYALIGEDGDHFLKYEVQPMTQLVDGKCTVNNHAHIIEGTDQATREWFYYYFMHRDIFSFLSRQGAGRYKLNKSSLEKIPLLVPPVSEQKKIVQILSTWDNAITTAERLLANSQQQKKALMQQLLTGKKRLLDKNGVCFKGRWESKPLSKMGEVIGGLTYSPSDVTDETGTLVLRSSNIQNSRLSFEDNVYVSCSVPEKSVTQENDILICVRNGSRALIGKSALLQGKGVGCFHGAFMSIFRAQEPLFIFQLFQSVLFYREVMKNLGATINSINGSDLKKFTFRVPADKAERERIADVLSSADQEIAALQQNLIALKKEKSALMQQLLAGKRRVKSEGAN